MNTTLKIRFRTLVAAGLLVALGQASHAQENRTLSLEEAVSLSLSNSKQLKISQSNIDLAGQNIREIRENQLPSLSVSGSYLRLNTPNISLKMPQSGNDSSGTSATDLKVHQAMYGMASASLPLFSGFRFKYGLESAKYLEQAAKLDIETDRQAVIQNTVMAYSNLYKAKTAVDLVTENLAREKQRVEDFTNREKNGMLARNDLMKAKLQESNVELALLDAENQLKVTTINMNLLLGLPETTVLQADSASFMALKEAGNANEWEQTALAHRQDVAANGLRQKAADANIHVAKADLYPSFALTAGYVALNIPGVAVIPNAMNAGIGLRYDIGAFWKSGAKIERAKTQAYQLRTNEQILLDRIHLEVNTAYYNYVLSKRKIEVYAKAVEQANENYRITKNKYDNSLVTTTDLLDADVAQVQSRINFEAARADAVVAYKRLEQTAGIINQ
ncbi:TolC family protein [Dyadobacter sandarakinus]|uniref:TolC family protein n=1 Tax=Dyadobacter sandarakinus TaxID=2747268 RepID=A0ABX7I515_9BACT|nr:TolC family protein [Dyadobacter sandarakinus]QRR00959.1 TolC family protein [Dyadobacter sandarakinus]